MLFAPIINRNEVFLPSFTYLPHSVGMDFQKTVLTEDMYILYKILENTTQNIFLYFQII